MGIAISEDLRWRVIYLFYDSYGIQEIAELLRLSTATVKRILACYRQWKCVINPLKGPTGRRKIFNGTDMKILCKIVKEYPDYYLDEIVGEMLNKTGKEVSIPTLWRSLKYCGITRKKLEKAARERSELLRADYIYTIGTEYRAEQLIFLDESAKDERTLSRSYGYSLINQAISHKVVFLRGVRYTILPALTIDGFIACDIMKGSCSKERFCTFILSQVLPFMNPFPGKNSVLVMDNAKIHHDNEMVNVIERSGCKVLYLPPYSPDYNPIETAFSTVKIWIRRNKDFMETCTNSEFAIMAACSQITSEMAKSYFEKSNYI